MKGSGTVGRVGCLLLVLVVLLFAWDQWRIEQMRRDVERLSSKVHIEKTANKASSGGATDLVTALARAQKHTTRAKELIRKKRTAEAQAELDKALKSLESANTVSRDIAGDAAEFIGKQRDRAVQVFQKAWQDISKEAKPKKIDVDRK